MSYSVRGQSSEITLDAEQTSSWIEAVPAVDKDRNGKWYFTVTTDDLHTYAKSLKKRPGQVPVDYDHEGDVGGSTRAAGWFTGKAKVVLAGEETPRGETATKDALWAEVDWTPRAVQEIRDGEFRFTSPVFTFKKRDPNTGLMTEADEIVASTLTNRPHFTQLEPVMAAVVWAPDQGYEALRERVCDALNPTDHPSFWVMDIADGRALVREYDEQLTWVVPFSIGENGEILIEPRSQWTAAEEQWVAATEASHTRFMAARPNPKEKSMDNAVVAKSLGLAETATDEQITEALAAQAAKVATVDELETKVAALTAAADGDDDAREKRISELENEITELKAERTVERVKELLATATREGRIVPASHEALAKQFEKDPDGLEAVLASFPKREGLKGQAASDTPAGDGGEHAAEFESRSGGKVTAADEEGLDLHARATKILGDKKNPTQDEYLAALAQAEREAA